MSEESLDNLVCPKCSEGDIREKRGHNVSNLTFGLAVGATLGLAIGFPLLDDLMDIVTCAMPAGAAVLMPIFYFTDTPFGQGIEYHCNKGGYSWDRDEYD